MSKTTKIILILIFILIIAIVGFFFYKSKTDKPIINPITNQPFDPFGPNRENNEGGEEVENEKPEWTNNTNSVQSKFYQITNFAVAGASFYEQKITVVNPENKTETVSTVPSLSYVERATGHIYQMNIENRETNKVSNSTIPNVYEVFIDKLSDTFIYRYLAEDNKTITTFMAKLGNSKGEFLATDIIDMSLSSDRTKAFYLAKNSTGVIGFNLSLQDNKKSQVFTSSFTEWISQWVENQKIYLTTKPSSLVSGSIFSLDTQNGTLIKIFGGVDGLTTLSNSDGSQVLYGASLSTGPKLWLLNTEDHTTTDLNSFGLPEKCVWSKDDIHVYCAVPNKVVGTQYPEYWYQGLISFDDYFVKINTITKEKVTLANSQDETPIDGTYLFLDKEESRLFFINKKNSTLWSLDL